MNQYREGDSGCVLFPVFLHTQSFAHCSLYGAFLLLSRAVDPIPSSNLHRRVCDDKSCNDGTLIRESGNDPGSTSNHLSQVWPSRA